MHSSNHLENNNSWGYHYVGCPIICEPNHYVQVRALLLEMAGYDVRVFEFIGGEHTAKNVMVAAVKRSKLRSDSEVPTHPHTFLYNSKAPYVPKTELAAYFRSKARFGASPLIFLGSTGG